MALLEKLAAEPPLRMDADGVVRVGGTRVTLDTVVGAYEEGATAEEIVLRYDSLPLGDVYSAIGYYLRNREEVTEYLARRREQAEAVQQENLRRWPTAGLRERLLARRNSGQGQSRPTLEELLARVTDANIHTEVQTGPAVESEVW